MQKEPVLRKKPIGITGGIASGKSTVCEMIREAGFLVDSADDFAKNIFESDANQASLGKIFQRELPIAREFLREMLVNSPENRSQINQILHPPIWQMIEDSQAAFIEVPLLIETCLLGSFSQVWVVWCPPELQLERLAKRLQNEELARQMIGTQLPLRAKIPFADAIIRTNAEIDSVRDDVAKLLQIVCAE